MATDIDKVTELLKDGKVYEINCAACLEKEHRMQHALLF